MKKDLEPINYEGLEIEPRNDKWLIVDWYEYYDTKAEAMNAVADYLKQTRY